MHDIEVRDHGTVENRLSSGRFDHHNHMRAELPIAVQGVSRGTLLVRALYVEGMYL